jgi:hypothetical protein
MTVLEMTILKMMVLRTPYSVFGIHVIMMKTQAQRHTSAHTWTVYVYVVDCGNGLNSNLRISLIDSHCFAHLGLEADIVSRRVSNRTGQSQ